MQKYKVEIPRCVFEELEGFARFIAEHSVKAALEWYDHMEEKIQSLDTSPARCPVAEESQYFDYEIRHLIVGSYRVLFRIHQDSVKILHVFHGKMERKPID